MYAFLLTVAVEGEAPYQVKVGNPTPPEALPLLLRRLPRAGRSSAPVRTRS